MTQVKNEIERSGMPVKCVTELHSFKLCCLELDVLRVANMAYIDHFGRHGRERKSVHEYDIFYLIAIVKMINDNI
jgi:hypothetical protein